MLLHTTEWGTGAPDIVLLHGMMGSGSSWWRVAPDLAARGHRVVAMDLPGHGESQPLHEATVETIVALVVQTWESIATDPPRLAIGHSYGGTILAAALGNLRPAQAVFVDSPFTKRGNWDPGVVRPEYLSDKAARTYEGLRARRPFYSHHDRVVEARAAELFDVETAVALAAAAGGDWTPVPPPRLLLIRPEPSRYISAEGSARLADRGIEVRSIDGAEHSVWYSHFDEFMSAIDDCY